MGITERRAAEREQLKKKIFDTASEIIIDEGFEKLSIRKLADRIEYSPGVIYNYFKDKNEIVQLIIDENIQNICNTLLSINLEMMDPKAAIEIGFTEYARLMLENFHQYKAVMMSGINLSLFKYDTSKIDTIKKQLMNVLNNGKKSKDFDIQDEKETALLLLSAVLGLINSIITEGIEDKNVQQKLIKDQIKLLIKGISN